MQRWIGLKLIPLTHGAALLPFCPASADDRQGKRNKSGGVYFPLLMFEDA